MHDDQSKDLGRNATALMATAFVVLLGVGFCGFIVVAFADEPAVPLLICGVMVLTVLLFAWLLRDRPQHRVRERNFFWMSRKEVQMEPEYMPRRRHRKSRRSVPNQPPTVERVRDLANNVNTWVPSGRPPKR